MKTKTIISLGVASLCASLWLAGSATAAEEERTNMGQLNREQRTFLIFIRDGENEYKNATNRASLPNPLWQNNLLNAQVRLFVVFTLMDGNQEIKPHQSRIGALKKLFRERAAVERLTTNYLTLRDRAYDLQNKLNPLCEKLDPSVRKWLADQERKIKESGTPETAGGKALSTIQAAESGGTLPVPPQPGGRDSIDLGGGYSYNAATGVVSGPNGPIPGATFKDGKIVFPSGYSVDPATGRVYGPDGKLIPGATFRNGKIYLTDGTWIDPITGKSSGSAAALSEQDTTRIKQEGGYTGFEILNGRPTALTIKYADHKGGRIDSEVVEQGVLEGNPPRFKPGGDKGIIEWAFLIKPSGEGSRLTFELVNEGTPGAEFEVVAWEGPDGRKETSEKSFTVTFPKTGSYTIKVEGKTKKYGSKFELTRKVDI